jgi:two-component system, NtrC family, sensor kinase
VTTKGHRNDNVEWSISHPKVFAKSHTSEFTRGIGGSRIGAFLRTGFAVAESRIRLVTSGNGADVRVRLNLQWKILLLVGGAMSAIVLASSYLYSVRTRSLIEKDHHDNAVSQTLALANRISDYDYFSSLDDMAQEMQLVAGSRPDFKQIDVYENGPTGPRLIATTSPGAETLLALSNATTNTETSNVHSIEISRENSDYWLVTARLHNPQHSGFIQTLVLKSYRHGLVDSLHRQYSLVLVGAVLALVVLLYLLFTYFFRRPVRDIVQTMATARKGEMSARAMVHRDDELGEIARGYNRLMDEIADRSREREDLMKQIGELNSELMKRVDVATSNLRAANGNLIRTQQRLAYAERMAAIGQVAASLAHEIGTPLNAIAGHLHLVAQDHPNAMDTQRRLNIINSQLASIVQTVKSLLERTHRRPIQPTMTDINTIVQELLLLVEPLFDSRNIKVSLQLHESLPRVPADPESLHQVFLNLVNNSLDAMPEGGEMAITTDYLAELEMIEVRFTDSGTGVPAEALDYLFEPMWTTKQSGTGLGLSIAREIVIEHGGTIEYVSAFRKGAEFRLTLPVAITSSKLSSQIEVITDAA